MACPCWAPKFIAGFRGVPNDKFSLFGVVQMCNGTNNDLQIGVCTFVIALSVLRYMAFVYPLLTFLNKALFKIRNLLSMPYFHNLFFLYFQNNINKEPTVRLILILIWKINFFLSSKCSKSSGSDYLFYLILHLPGNFVTIKFVAINQKKKNHTPPKS